MSRLFSLARQVSEYLRNRMMRRYRELDDSVELSESLRSRSFGGRRGLPARLPELLQGGRRSPRDPDFPGDDEPVPGAPPRQSPLRPGYGPTVPPPPPSGPGAASGEEDYDDIQILGRDAGYDVDDFDAVMDNLRRTPGSDNVWGYFYERESRRTGILYVTFLRTNLEGKKENLPGPTYAYYDVPVVKAIGFERAAPSSAGGAVWDYLRIRGTVYGHQHQYRLVHVSGEYVPRKASPYGFVKRAVPALGVGRRSFRRNTLAPYRWGNRGPGGEPDRGRPDRGEPDRGEPDRG